MTSHWQKLLRKRLKRGLGRAARVAASLGLVFTLFGPNPYSPLGDPVKSAEAKNLEWGDMRGVLTDEADSTDADGFVHLPDYGRATHAIVVAPNGDIFTAGTGADVDANGDGDCGDAVDANQALATCEAAAAVSPVVYKSVDGGMKWRPARLLGAVPGAAAGTTVRKIVVSPDYPTDNFVAVVLTTDATADVATDANGICWSTNGGNDFTAAACRTGADFAAEPDLDDVLWRTIALSPNFNWNDGSGSVAIGGRYDTAGVLAGTTAIATTVALKATLAATTFTKIGETTATAADAVTDLTLDLAFTYDEEPIALARVFVLSGTNTFAQVRTGATWGAVAAGDTSVEILDTPAVGAAAAIVATQGSVAFDDDYATGGAFWASAGNAAAGTGGVYLFDGTAWVEKTTVRAACNRSVDDITVAGNGSATRLVASLTPTATDPARVCRSVNEGSAWSDNNADGGDSVCDQCRIDGTAGTTTRVSNNRKTPEMVTYTHSGARGGVMKSSNTGSSWADTGLTNEAYVATGVDEVSTTEVFVSATVPAGQVGAALDAVFWSNSYGTGSAYVRVLRYDSTDLVLGNPGDFATAGVSWARRSAATVDPILRSTDRGRTFDNTSADPYENSPEANETCAASSSRSATTYYCGGSKGHVAMTSDGGGSWTLLSTDFGEDVDEFDFTSDAKIFFVTGEHTDSTNKVWMTKDSGATFTQVGDAPWGTGDGGINTLITGYAPATNTGSVIVTTGAGTTTTEVYRHKIGESTWTDLDMDVEWDSALTTSATVGDRVMLTLWDNDGSIANPLQYTVMPLTGKVDDYDSAQGAANERKNPLLVLPPPPVTTGTMGTSRGPSGSYVLQTTTGGRVMELTLASDFRAGPKLTSPPKNTSVPSNVGDNGIPTIFRWDSVGNADLYHFNIGLQPDLTDGTVTVAGITTSLVVVDDTTGAAPFPLVQGNTYYWAVRVGSSDNVAAAVESPWSEIWSFSVASAGAPTSPEAQLPLDNTTTSNVGPIAFSFNLPAGTVQFHIQVIPLNGDGPAIDLIIGDPNMVGMGSYTVMPPVLGQGNYVMLPGATYTWRVRSTGKAGSITVTDSSWGPWSAIRVFRTPKPSSASISLQAVGTANVTTDTTPTLSWKDGNVNVYYYEVQLSGDAAFNQDPATATSFVYHNLVHGGVTTPLNSWTVPDSAKLAKGKYYWRVRPRVQATPLGPDEPGVTWTPAKSFTVQ